VHALLEAPSTPTTLFTTPAQGHKREPKETKSVSCHHDGPKTCIFERRCSLPIPQKTSDPFTHQTHPFTRHRKPNLQPSLLRTQQKPENTDVTTHRISPLDSALSASLLPAHLTLVFACVTAPAARSCTTTAACPLNAARCSGVSPFCGARQRSVRHTLFLRRCVRTLPRP